MRYYELRYWATPENTKRNKQIFFNNHLEECNKKFDTSIIVRFQEPSTIISNSDIVTLVRVMMRRRAKFGFWVKLGGLLTFGLSQRRSP